jgi:hypothetical protein
MVDISGDHRHWPRRRTAWLIAISVAASAVAVWFALQADPAKSGTTSRRAASGATGSPTGYAVLDRAPTSADRVTDRRITPEVMARQIPELQVDATRVLRRDAVSTLAVIPRTDGQLCLAKMNASGSAGLDCTDPTIGNPALVNYGYAVGLVPDEVHEVTFHLASGQDATAEVHGNLYAAPPEADSVSFAVGGRVQKLELMPLSSLPKNASIGTDGTVEMRATR